MPRQFIYSHGLHQATLPGYETYESPSGFGVSALVEPQTLTVSSTTGKALLPGTTEKQVGSGPRTLVTHAAWGDRQTHRNNWSKEE